MTRKNLGLASIVGLVTVVFGPSPASAQTSPPLGNATSYSVLAGSQVTNTGTTFISGNVGIRDGVGVAPHFSGFGTVIFTGGGSVHDADVSALNAKQASFPPTAGNAFGALDQTCTVTYAGANKQLAGETLVPGVYCASEFLLNGTLILTGSASDTWIFKSGRDLIITTAAARVVSPSCNVWWRLVRTATFGAGSSLVGNILASTSITLANGASLSGRALVDTAEVTLIGNTISACVAAVVLPPAVCPVVTVAPTPLPNGTVAVAYTQTLTASGGAAPYTFGVTGGTLPTGMTLTTPGVLAGTPTAAGTFAFTIEVRAANGCGTTVNNTITIAAAPPPAAVCPVITIPQTTLPNMAVGVAYSTTLTASGGTAPYNFGVTAGALPAGMTLTAGGVLAGTPTAVAAATFTIRATDANGCFAELSYTVTPAAGPIPVPTLPQWAFMVLALLLGATGVMALRRRTP